MAMSCLAFPVLGRPTRRARLSSASVDCGISEKSIWLSEICVAFFTACLPRADDANRFFATIFLIVYTLIAPVTTSRSSSGSPTDGGQRERRR